MLIRRHARLSPPHRRPALLSALLSTALLTGCPAPVEDKADGSDTPEDEDSGGSADDGGGTADGADGADGTADGADAGSDGGTASPWYADADGDGFGDPASRVDAAEAPEGHVADDTDCDDSAPDVNPDAAEVCDGIDNDCDGATDPGTAAGATLWYADADADTFGDPWVTVTACEAPAGFVADNTDCAPTEGTAYPGSAAWEHIGDGVDQDCDGLDGCADFDCDGLPDIVLMGAYDGDSNTQSSVYFGGDSFAEGSKLTIPGHRVFSGAAGDLDGDGFTDLILANQRDASSYVQSVDVHLGSATGPSVSPDLSLGTVGANDVALVDIDEDGYPDIIVANGMQTGSSPAPNSTVYWGGAAGFSSADRTDLPTQNALKLKVADVDGDLDLDLIFCNNFDGATRLVNSRVYFQGASGFAATTYTDLPTVGCADVDVGDINGDGYTDIVFASLWDGATYRLNSYVYPGSAAGFIVSERFGLETWGANDLEIADFNADGYDDVVFTAQESMVATPSARTYLYWGDPSGPSTARREGWGIDAIQGAKAADLNGDGLTDLVFAHSFVNNTYTTTSSAVYWGTGTSFLSAPTRLSTEGPTTVLIGDLDDDGFADLLFPGYQNGAGYTSATAKLYWGAAGAAPYSSASVLSLATGGGVINGLLVGDSSW